MESGSFSDMQGLTLEAMKQVVLMGRWPGKVELYRHGQRWALLFTPHNRLAGKVYYLMGEKSRQPRLFAKADTAIRIAETMAIPELRVNFHGLELKR